MPDPIDTTNKFIVSAQGNDVIILRAVSLITQEDALNLAAYLVALSEQRFEDFVKVYEAVCNA